MLRIDSADVTFHVPPANQGQMIEVAYAFAGELLVRRETNRSTGSVSYFALNLDWLGCGPATEPWNGDPTPAEAEESDWKPCHVA